MRRVVVTGIGCISPIGNTVQESWDALLAGQCGIGMLSHFDASAFGCQIAGEVKNFDAAQYLPAKEVRRFDRFIHYGVGAATQAIADAHLDVKDKEEEALRAGVLIGSGVGGLSLQCEAYGIYLERGPRRYPPVIIPATIINTVSGQVSILYGLKGPNLATVTACASGLHAIGEASWIIRRDDADVMIAGGAEACICPDTLGGFDIIHTLSRNNADPTHASRPFDAKRDGIVLGEGAGVLVLEELEHAKARGAHIYCEITGYGLTGDAYHITMPSTDGATRCMQMALKRANLAPEAIDFIYAHGTSTPIGDLNEAKAIETIFGTERKNLFVTSTKGATGHPLGAAGGIESVFSVLALKHQIVPPTINLSEQDPECHVTLCTKAQKHEIHHVLKSNFGFGGTNASVIYSEYK